MLCILYVEDNENKLSDSGRRDRQSGQSRDRRDHSERRASCCPRDRVASRGARCQHEPGDRRGLRNCVFSRTARRTLRGRRPAFRTPANDLTTYTAHLKDRSRGGTRGPMSKERLTSADATRPGYGLRGRLLLSFIAISSFAAIAAIVGTYALYTIGKALHEMTDRSIPPAILSLELAQRTERILAVGPTLLGVSSANELAGESSALDQEFKEGAQLVLELSNTGLAETELTEIQTAFAQVTANFTALKAVTQKRIASADRKVKLLREIFEAYNQFRDI